MSDTRIIRIFEDRQQKVRLSEQEKKDILSMRAIVGENNVILQTDGKLLIKHYVGFIQINKTRLLIYPKIARGSVDKEDYKKSFEILMKLLSYSSFVSVKRIPTPQALDKYNGDLLELFIGLFVDEILLQFKRDINRGYNNLLENQTFIKGKIDFRETIKKNSFKKHLHYVNYDQFSEDILLNRIFKSVIHKLITRTGVKNNKLKLKQSLLWLEDVEFIQLDNEIWNQVKFTRQNAKYEPAFNLAKLFYFNSSPNLNVGDEYTFSFLVPVNRLFETYLYKVLQMNMNNAFKVNYQSPRYYLAYDQSISIKILKVDLDLQPEVLANELVKVLGINKVVN